MQSKLAKFVAAIAFAGVVGAQAAAPATPQGVITAKEYLGITGTAVANLTASPKFQNNTPDVTSYSPQFEWPINTADPSSPPPGDVRNDYGTQIIGYFYPETSGNHSFYISADDGAVLYLSTDDTAANKVSIATEPTWNGVRDYMGTARRPVADADTGRLVNQSAPINLVAGRAYYIEALAKEGGGGDNLSVAVVLEGETPTVPIPGARLATIDKTAGPVSITTQPANITVAEGAPFTLTVVANGTPPYTYQWNRNGQPIAGATGPSYTVAASAAADNGASYTVTITNNDGANTITSSAAVATVQSDTSAPTIASARGNKDLNTVTVIFSEPVTAATAGVVGNYSLSPSLAISSATVVNPTTVRLATGAQTQNTEYTLTVNNVKDASVAGNTIVANSTSKFKAWTRQAGFVTAEFFRDIGTVNLTDLIAAQKYIDNAPDEVRFLPSVDTPNGYGDNYGIRVTGWLAPTVSGDYDFFVRADDQAALFINPDGEALPDASDPFAAQAAETSGCCEAFKEPDGFSTETTLAPIPLVAGRKYGVVFLMKEGGGGDWAQLAWRRVGDTTSASALTPISGGFFETMVDPTGASINITNQPASQTVVQSRTATFSVGAATSATTGAVSYQWMKNGSAIAGATSASYTTPAVTLADNNAKYSVRIRVPGLDATSQEATLTVSSDATAPKVASAGALQGSTSVGIQFDESVDPVSAAVAGNYQIAGNPVTAVKLHPGGVVELTVTSPIGASFNVAVSGVKDVAGNTMANATVTGQISDLRSQDVGVPGDPILPGKAFSTGAGVYVAGGGSDIWNSADAFHFAYKEFTGAFDAKVRLDAFVDLVPQDAWSKLGIAARESLDAGARYEGYYATRNTGNGQNQYTHQWREVTDGASGSLGANPVTYPSWIRFVRESATSNEFKSYYSLDGVNWTLHTTHTTAGATLPAKLFIGLGVTSHGNLEVQGNGEPEVLAEGYFSNFSVVPFVAAFNPQLTVGTAANGQVTISWTSGTLVSADTLGGTYTPVAGATSPMTIPAAGNAKFYRVRQ